MARIEQKEVAIEVPRISKGGLVVNIVGTRPLICNRMSEKARHELVFPQGRKNAAQKQSSLKHDPVAEYQASPYLAPDTAATLLAVPSSAFKGAMSMAALDLPNTKKAQIGRLVYVEREYTAVYGKPLLYMSVVRNSDMGHTPDIRTRAILPRWACQLEISYVQPLLTAQAIVNLLSAAGVTVGIGDWRPEKGKGSFGQFTVVNSEDPELLSIMTEGRAIQAKAMASPEPYDAESAELLSWWIGEAKTRGFASAVDTDSEDEEGE